MTIEIPMSVIEAADERAKRPRRPRTVIPPGKTEDVLHAICEDAKWAGPRINRRLLERQRGLTGDAVHETIAD